MEIKQLEALSCNPERLNKFTTRNQRSAFKGARGHIVCHGGAVLADIMADREHMWLMKQKWEEQGKSTSRLSASNSSIPRSCVCLAILSVCNITRIPWRYTLKAAVIREDGCKKWQSDTWRR